MDTAATQTNNKPESETGAGLPALSAASLDGQTSRIEIGDMVFSNPMDQISAALVDAHGEIERVVAKETADIKNDAGRTSYSYKYADLAAIFKAAKPALLKYGLCLLQPLSSRYDERGQCLVRVTPMLVHKSGQWCYARALEMKPASGTPQALGSAGTYCRRYSSTPLLGIAPEDDDGAAASSSALTSGAAAATPEQRKEPAPGANQLRAMYKQAREINPTLPEDITEWIGQNVEGYVKGKGLSEAQSHFCYNTFKELLALPDPAPAAPPASPQGQLEASLDRPISENARKALMAMFNEAGITNDAERHEFANVLVGKPSSKMWNGRDFNALKDALAQRKAQGAAL